MTRMDPSWGPGPWDAEPDREEWVDEATGLDCAILRQPRKGHLCGYVRVPEGHPWHGTDEHDYPDADVHGSVTWTGAMPAPSDPTPGWWVGFDCAHSWDETPGRGDPVAEAFQSLGSLAEAMTGMGDWDNVAYRDYAYVRAEVTRLARQVADAGEAA